MATCLTELFIWSLKGNVNIPDFLIGCHSYHEKNEAAPNQRYFDERKQFTEGRDMVWSPKNKRPEKLRDNIKEMEELLSAFRLVQFRWRSRKTLQLILSNACIINVNLCGQSGDIEKLLIDKSLVGKLSGEIIYDAHMTDQYMVATFPDKARVDYVYFCKRPPLGEAIKKLEKMSSWEPKVTPIDIPGPVGRRLDRRLSVNIHQDLVLVWWSNSSKEAMPWSPMATDKERANVIIISVHGPNVDILTYIRTECDPQSVGFSCLQPHRLHSVERGMYSGRENMVTSCTYEVVQGKIQRASVVNIPLKSLVQCQCRSPGEDKLLLGCADGTLVLCDEYKKVTQTNRAGLIPCTAAWHPTGTIFFIASARGDIQIFDVSLTPIRVQLLAEEPNPHKMLQTSKYFKNLPVLKEISWCPFDPQASDWTGDYTDVLSIAYDRGPVCMLTMSLGVIGRERFSCVELVKEYIRAKQLEEAVVLLSAMNWDTDGASCYSCLTAIVTHLLKLPLNAEREVQLETALGTFYAPKRPLSEMTILDYRDPISRLARRFFHHLLRYARFDKAYLLAVDIGARDLFMDIHFMALDKGETALAEVARRKADQVNSESLDSFEYDFPGEEGNFYQQHQQQQQQPNGDQQPPLPPRTGATRTSDIPASRQHPWQQEDRTSQRPQHLPVSQHASQPSPHTDKRRNNSHKPPKRVTLREQDLSQDLDGLDIRDYTAALNDGQTWDQPSRSEGSRGVLNGKELHSNNYIIFRAPDKEDSEASDLQHSISKQSRP